VTRLRPPVKVRTSGRPDAPFTQYVDALASAAGAAATLLKREALAELERQEAAEDRADPRRPGVYRPGDRVVYTARWLQLCASCRGDAIAREWTVQACRCDLCAGGKHLCTTTALAEGGYWHVARAHVRHAGLVQTDDVAALELKRPSRRPRRAS